MLNDGTHSYQYDAENRITSVDNGSTSSYAYDYLNRRIKKTVGSSATHYVWKGNRVLAEHNALNGTGITDYVLASNMTLGTGPGNTLGSNGSFTYYLSDRLNIRVLTDRYGNDLGQQYHLPFGEDFAESGTQDKHHMTTYERDAEATTDYAVNREYEFNWGRFMAADPIADAAFRGGKKGGCAAKKGGINTQNPQSLNLYSYTLNDPINSRDQTGLETDSPCTGGDGGNPIAQQPDPGDPMGEYNPFLGPPPGIPTIGELGELGAPMPGVTSCPATPGTGGPGGGGKPGASVACFQLYSVKGSECEYKPISPCNVKCRANEITIDYNKTPYQYCPRYVQDIRYWNPDGSCPDSGLSHFSDTECYQCVDYQST